MTISSTPAVAAISVTLMLTACAQSPTTTLDHIGPTNTGTARSAKSGAEINLQRTLGEEFDKFIIIDGKGQYATALIGENCGFDIDFPDGVEQRASGYSVVYEETRMTVQGRMGVGLVEMYPNKVDASPLGDLQQTVAKNLSRNGFASLFDLSGCGQSVDSPTATPPGGKGDKQAFALGESIEFDVDGASGTATLVDFHQGKVNQRDGYRLTFRVSVSEGSLKNPESVVCYLPDNNPNMVYPGRWEEGIQPLSKGKDQLFTAGVTPPLGERLQGRITFGDCLNALRNGAPHWLTDPAPLAQVEGVDESFAGTTWQGSDDYFSQLRFELASDGSAKVWTQQDGMASFEELEDFGSPYTWGSDGETLTVQNQSWTFNAVRNGASMTGTATYVRGAQHRFALEQK